MDFSDSLLSFLFLVLISLIWFSLNLGNEYKNYFYLFSVGVLVFASLLLLLIFICLKPYIIDSFLQKLSIAPKLKEKLSYWKL